jgi:hypothetical protein
MEKFSRYGIYYAPPKEHSLAKFSASWLGWDANVGFPINFSKLQGLRYKLSEITKKPRKYGFHGTLKPPFALKEGKNPEELLHDVSNFSKTIRGFEIPKIKLQNLDGFIAIVPEKPCPKLQDLARKCVLEFDYFREIETFEQVQKRRILGLTQSQENNLIKWGYPFVLEDFNFHLTLSGRLQPDCLNNIMSVLSTELDEVLKLPLRINELCVVGEIPITGYFQIIHRFPFID